MQRAVDQARCMAGGVISLRIGRREHDDTSGKMAELIRVMKVGDGMDAQEKMGPLVSEESGARAVRRCEGERIRCILDRADGQGFLHERENRLHEVACFLGRES